MQKLKSYLFRGGTLLGASAILSKLLGFWRDRLLVLNFDPSQADLVFAAFRIPDFFFYLFVGATLSVILVPRMIVLNEREKIDYVSSFYWGVFIFFGIISLIGGLWAEKLVYLFASGFDDVLKLQIAHLSQYLFGSVFLLGLSGVFAAYLQASHKFISFALAPLFYMGSLCLGLFFFGNNFGILIIGYSAIIGASIHLLANVLHFYLSGGKIRFCWKKPKKSWTNFQGDFWRRVLNNSAFQINQTVDVLIASFLITGAVTAFSIGTNFGHILLSIVGFSVANTAFPKFSHAKNNPEKQKAILKSALKWILLWTIPFSIIGALGSTILLQTLFSLDGERLIMTQKVFFWTVISLPAACSIPVLSRVFLANDDSLTPLLINAASLLVATALAAILALKILPPENAILGLAYGNFTANTLSALLFLYVFTQKKWKPISS